VDQYGAGERKDVLVISGGFTGVWSAARAVRAMGESGAQVRVTLDRGGDDLVVRPRLYEEDPQAKPVSRTARVDDREKILAQAGRLSHL
jgi:hypothetical protein